VVLEEVSSSVDFDGMEVPLSPPKHILMEGGDPNFIGCQGESNLRTLVDSPVGVHVWKDGESL